MAHNLQVRKSIHVLPVELISYILLFATTHTSPVLLSHIDTKFRQIALQYASATLWSTIILREPDDATLELDRIAAFLTRSRVALVDLDFLFDNRSLIYIRRLIAVIRPHSHRVRYLKLSLNRSRFMSHAAILAFEETLMAAFDIDVPALEHLDSDSFYWDIAPYSFLKGSAQMLKKITISNGQPCALGSDLLWIDCPLETLEFYSDGYQDPELPELLRCFQVDLGKFASVLVNLQLFSPSPDETVATWPNILPLTRLEILGLSDQLTYLLPHIEAPSIKTLEIAPTPFGLQRHLPDLTTYIRIFAHRHASSLERVVLNILAGDNTFEIHEEETAADLARTAFPRLTFLNITGAAFSISSLLADMEAPILRTMGILVSESSPFEWSIFGRFLNYSSDQLLKLDIEGLESPNTGYDYVHVLEDVSRFKFPMLVSLHLEDVSNIDVFSRHIESARSLRSLFVSGYEIDDGRDIWRDDIEFPRLEETTITGCFAMLRGLVAPHIGNVMISHTSVSPQPVEAFLRRHRRSIISLHLKLTVAALADPAHLDLFPPLDMPHLQELRTTYHWAAVLQINAGNLWFLRLLGSKFTPARAIFSGMRTVTSFECDICIPNLPQIIASFKALECLAVQVSNEWPEEVITTSRRVWESLSVPNPTTGQPICPVLNEFEVFAQRGAYLDMEPFVDMLEARSRHASARGAFDSVKLYEIEYPPNQIAEAVVEAGAMAPSISPEQISHIERLYPAFVVDVRVEDKNDPLEEITIFGEYMDGLNAGDEDAEGDDSDDESDGSSDDGSDNDSDDDSDDNNDEDNEEENGGKDLEEEGEKGVEETGGEKIMEGQDEKVEEDEKEKASVAAEEVQASQMTTLKRRHTL